MENKVSEFKHVRALTWALSTVSLVLGLALLANAQQPQSPTAPTQTQRDDRDITRRELRSFDGFLDTHHEIAKDLRKDPTLVDNADYLAKHPELQAYLNNHPGVRGELKEHPRYFMRRERRYERHEHGEGHCRKRG